MEAAAIKAAASPILIFVEAIMSPMVEVADVIVSAVPAAMTEAASPTGAD